MAAGEPLVKTEHIGKVALLTIDNPPVNATSHALRSALKAALEATIGFYERLDRHVAILMARRNELLEQIDILVQGLGQCFRRESDHIIDGDFTETKQEAPSITSPGGDAQ